VREPRKKTIFEHGDKELARCGAALHAVDAFGNDKIARELIDAFANGNLGKRHGMRKYIPDEVRSGCWIEAKAGLHAAFVVQPKQIDGILDIELIDIAPVRFRKRFPAASADINVVP